MGTCRTGARRFLPLPLLLLVAGCATNLQTPVAELDEPGPNEGIVIGSVLIELEEPKDPSRWDVLGGPRLTASEWSVEVKEGHRRGLHASLFGSPFSKTLSLDVQAGVPARFVAALPAGSYRFDRIVKRGYVNPVTGDLEVPFTVHGGQASYLGLLVVRLPARLGTYGRLAIEVRDDRAATLAWVRESSGRSLDDAAPALLGGGRAAAAELPRIFDDVWYRPTRRPSGLLAASDTVVLTVEREAMKLQSEEQDLAIAFSDVVRVTYGTVGIDTFNWWTFVEYADAAAPSLAVITDGGDLGWSGRSGEIFATIKHAIESGGFTHVEIVE